MELTSALLAPAAHSSPASSQQPSGRCRCLSLSPLNVRDVSKSYGDRIVLDGIDLTATPGQPVGLVGENGVGKSTLLRILAGREAPDGGERLRGRPSSATSPRSRSSTSRIARSPRCSPTRSRRCTTPYDGWRTWRTASTTRRSHASTPTHWSSPSTTMPGTPSGGRDEAAARLGLEDISPDSHGSAELSGGQRSRLAMAALITRRPECLLIDEPTNHLDDAALEFVEEFLTSLPGVVVVASHDRVLLDDVAARRSSTSTPPTSGPTAKEAGGSPATSRRTWRTRHAARRRWEQAFLEQQDELNELRRRARTTARQVAHNRGPRDNDKFIYAFKGANVQSTIRRRVRDAEQRIARPRTRPDPQATQGDQLRPAAHGRGVGCWVGRRFATWWWRTGSRSTGSTSRPASTCLVTGANGSGKTTLLRVLAGEVAADIGTGRRVVRGGSASCRRRSASSARTASAHQLYAEMAPGDATPLGDLGLLHPRDLGKPVGDPQPRPAATARARHR